MLDLIRRMGSVRLKVLLLTVCIVAAMVVIYIRLRPTPPARLAPEYTPSFGRNSARNADRSAESQSPLPQQLDDR